MLADLKGPDLGAVDRLPVRDLAVRGQRDQLTLTGVVEGGEKGASASDYSFALQACWGAVRMIG